MNARENLPTELVVLLSGRAVGQVVRDGSKLMFFYDDSWRQKGPGIPLSMSMPLSKERYEHDIVSNWMWGLLTDNEVTLSRIASQHKVSATNVFALLWKIGQDCAGAVQFAERAVVPKMSRGGSVEWLEEDEVAARLVQLRLDHASGRKVNEGQFSLPGAQPKIALILDNGKWGVPSGSIPTTHILKPPIGSLTGHAENEVFCLRLANKVGLLAAEAKVMRFKTELAIAVKRFDRMPTENGNILRIHQEDICQALAMHPSKKYEKDGGPGIKDIMTLLTRSTAAEEDRHRFMEATVFNFLIAGTDAHAKNYSLLFGPNKVRLAPLYDIASFLPYYASEGHLWQDIRMPMRIDKYYRYSEILPRHLERLSNACNYPGSNTVDIVARLAAQLPNAAAKVAADLLADGVVHPVVKKLVDEISWRCSEIERIWSLKKPGVDKLSEIPGEQPSSNPSASSS